MKKYLKWSLISAIIAAAGVAIAQVPNTFSAGQPVTASAMNQNFAYAAVPHVKDGAGISIGKVIGVTDTNIYVLNNSGYKMKLDYSGNIFNSGAVVTGAGYFTNATCTTALPLGNYIQNGSPNTIYNMGGTIYYTTAAPVTYSTIYIGGYGCVPSANKLVQLTANVPATTGVSAVSYAVPLTIQ